MPRSPYDHPSAKHSKRDWYDYCQITLMALGFLAAVAAGIVGYKNLDRLHRQTAITTEQVHNGQRAYLLVKNLRLRNKPTSLVVGTPMWFEWNI